MIKATPAVAQAKAWDVFYQTAFSAAGYAVNQDYYGQGALFVVGNDKGANGCSMLNGERVAHHQRRIKQGKNMGHELGSMMNAAQSVECLEFLK